RPRRETGPRDRRRRPGAGAWTRGTGWARIRMGGGARRLRAGQRQRTRRRETDQGPGTHGTGRAAGERHRAKLLPVFGYAAVEGSAAAVRNRSQRTQNISRTRDVRCDRYRPDPDRAAVLESMIDARRLVAEDPASREEPQRQEEVGVVAA